MAGLIAKPKKEKRECLKCGRLFNSEGKFNRICPGCKGQNVRVGSTLGRTSGSKSRHGGVKPADGDR